MKLIFAFFTVLSITTVVLVQYSECHKHDKELYEAFRKGSTIGKDALNKLFNAKNRDDFCVKLSKKIVKVKDYKEVTGVFTSYKVTFKMQLKVEEVVEQFDVISGTCDMTTVTKDDKKDVKKIYYLALGKNLYCHLKVNTDTLKVKLGNCLKFKLQPYSNN